MALLGANPISIDAHARIFTDFNPGQVISIRFGSSTVNAPEQAGDDSLVYINLSDEGFHSDGNTLFPIVINTEATELYISPNFRVVSYVPYSVDIIVVHRIDDAVLRLSDGYLHAAGGASSIYPNSGIGFTTFSHAFQVVMNGQVTEVFDVDAELMLLSQTPQGSRRGSLREFGRRSFAISSTSHSVVERTLSVG